MPDRAGPVAGGVRGDARCVSRVVPDVGCRAASTAAEGARTSPCAGDASRRPRAPSATCARAAHRRARQNAAGVAARAFRRSYYRRMVHPDDRRTPLTWASVPRDYAEQIRALRRARGLSQAQLATLVGATRKAVVYQWETGKRMPSPVFWRRLAALHQ